jgi:hypothetical protein
LGAGVLVLLPAICFCVVGLISGWLLESLIGGDCHAR